MIAIRYTISGGLMVAGAKVFGLRLPRGRELARTAACGIICIGIGNGCLAVAEMWIPSGLAALFYTTAPFWMVGLDAVLPHGRRPGVLSLMGLVVGVTGVVILVLPSVRHEGFRGATFVGFATLQLSAAGWTLGALLQKRVPTRSSPVIIGGVQQLAAGLAVFVPAALSESWPHHISHRSSYAVLYLVIFGSLLGFSAFIYAMARLPVALVSIYTFVNPVVAVALGWVLFREPFGSDKVAAMVVIFLGIAVVKRGESKLMAERNGSAGPPSKKYEASRGGAIDRDRED
jgi:drug/metabolite transporter (DMT)-like permease